MGNAAKSTRQNRTLTVDFHDETTCVALLGNTKALVEFVLAFHLSMGLQRTPQARGSAGGGRPRHAHEARVRLGALPLWRIQGTMCNAGCTVRPQCVWRSRTRRPEVARDALLAPHGGLSLAWGAVLWNIAPMALSRLVGALGQESRVAVLTRCELLLPVYRLADEKPHIPSD